MQLQTIQNRIYEVRVQQVMLDFDLGRIYEVESRTLNQAVKRNIDAFPEDFTFQLILKAWETKSSEIVMTFRNRKIECKRREED